ncbi:MAG: UDP-2,4-diacetamido-2,4,6-trideoxy-beta-L-altropyranose hydrolase [Planctomycetota bacterium]|nr:UDP-2,4-diacetamido-2,4,6-trideoxy-beta-L-altropyranose hydrolase [Planctomycetota bacterium]
MPGTLLLRADANAEIGTGHVMRCLALAQAWREEGSDAVFLMHPSSGSINDRLASEGCTAVTLQAETGSGQDAQETARVARDVGAGWVVVDGYAFDRRYQGALKEAGLGLLFVDDYGHGKSYCADLVLDQNIDTTTEFYADRTSATRLLLGARYALLRREFRMHRGWKRQISTPARRLLVTLGGGDLDNVTLKVIEALRQLDEAELEAVVVSGWANRHRKDLEAAAGRARCRIRVTTTTQEMPDLMMWADVAVSAGGTTCFEMTYLGLPHLIIILAENQERMARSLDRAGSAINLGWHGSCTPEEIARRLRGLIDDVQARTSMAGKGRDVLDAKGAWRVVEALRGVPLG